MPEEKAKAQREAYVESLKRELEGYERANNTDRAAAVKQEIDRVSGRSGGKQTRSGSSKKGGS